jgi:hypothetical protein
MILRSSESVALHRPIYLTKLDRAGTSVPLMGTRMHTPTTQHIQINPFEPPHYLLSTSPV